MGTHPDLLGNLEYWSLITVLIHPQIHLLHAPCALEGLVIGTTWVHVSRVFFHIDGILIPPVKLMPQRVNYRSFVEIGRVFHLNLVLGVSFVKVVAVKAK